MVKKGAEIRRLLARRVREWRQERIPELIQEYQRCAKQFSKSHVANSERSKDHVLRVFSNLMLRGDIRSATRWLTDQTGSGAVLDPSQLVDGQSVAHILQEKYPEASQSGTRAFMPCDELPPLVDVDITGSHIESAARRIRGGSGPGGSTGAQFQCYLLRFWSSSSTLRDAVAELGSSKVILSKEGVIQGDPLSMLMYAAAVMPLIKHLTDNNKWIQNWYANDSACAAKLSNLKIWFQKLCEIGPDFGYYPEPKKTVLIVRATEKDAAKALFGELGIKIVSGHRFLGGFVGEKDEVHDFVLEKVTTWTSGVNKLAEAAEFYPQAAFAALSKRMQFQWSYLQRVVPDCDSCFEVLRNALSDIFWPAVLQGTISDSEKKLFTLPARHGGMGIHDPLLTAASFTNSRKCTALIVDAIKCSSVFSVLDHTEHLLKLHRKIKQDIEILNLNLLESILPTLTTQRKEQYNEELMERPQHG
ncbi:hypothetical protein EMCRGX_G009716 [Ephydatia muelleri]